MSRKNKVKKKKTVGDHILPTVLTGATFDDRSDRGNLYFLLCSF